MTIGDRFLAEARRLIGVPKVDNGRSEYGVDCVGLLVLSAKRAGIPIEDLQGYSQIPDGHTLARYLRKNADQIFPVNCEWPFKDGDVIRTGYDYSTHVGIVGHLPDGAMSVIHCDRMGVHEERFTHESFPVRGLYRPRE